MNKVLCAVAAGVAMLIPTPPSHAASINYNSSKSNTGNITAPTPAPAACPAGQTMVGTRCTPAAVADPGQARGQPDMAVKNSGVPKNTSRTIDSSSPSVVAPPRNNSDGAAKGQADE
jgi:hypothetical protein